MEEETKRIDVEKVNEQLENEDDGVVIEDEPKSTSNEEDDMKKIESCFTVVITVGLVIVTMIALLMLSARFRYELDKSGAIQTCMEWLEVNVLPKYVAIMQFLCDIGGD